MAGPEKKWVTNLHTEAQEFALESGGFEVLQPGESKSLSIANPSSPRNLGYIHAGLFAISDKEPVAPTPATSTADAAVAESARIAQVQDPASTSDGNNKPASK